MVLWGALIRAAPESRQADPSRRRFLLATSLFFFAVAIWDVCGLGSTGRILDPAQVVLERSQTLLAIQTAKLMLAFVPAWLNDDAGVAAEPGVSRQANNQDIGLNASAWRETLAAVHANGRAVHPGTLEYGNVHGGVLIGPTHAPGKRRVSVRWATPPPAVLIMKCKPPR